jgi:hypothetical protein
MNIHFNWEKIASWIAMTIVALIFGACVIDQDAKAATVPYVHIADYVSAPGESETHFLQRVAPDMVAYSAQHNVETCGVVGKNGAGFSLILGTNQSHIGCVFQPSVVLPGFVAVDRIHSHINDKKTFFLNPADATLAGVEMPSGLQRQKIDATNHFSAWDYDAPGYLAIPGGILFEHGKGTETFVPAATN